MSGFIGSERPYRDGIQEAEMRLVAAYPYHDNTGKCYHLRDTDWHLIVWFSKRKQLIEVGDRILASFAIQSHRMHEGQEQNIAYKFHVIRRL
jgi:hypothetical protein